MSRYRSRNSRYRYTGYGGYSDYHRRNYGDSEDRSWYGSRRRYYGPGRPIAEEPELEKEEVNKRFHVKNIDFKVKENAKLHHTDKYQCCKNKKEEKQVLVVRRGQGFKICIQFDRAYNKEQNQMNFRFHIGSKPLPANGTEARVVMEEDFQKTRKNAKQWFVKMVENMKESKSIILEIFTPVTCIIGKWMIDIETESKMKEGGDTLKLAYKHDKCIFLLFNPYCEEDQLHMPSTELKEYIENEAGALFVGNEYQIGGRPWNFGQFYGEDGFTMKLSLEIILKAFNNQVNQAMGSPVKVARAITKMVNANDGGILVGNWSGDYSDGTAPGTWTGSIKILQKYKEGNGKSVNYGQCWVFSALTTTICRAIGIPCRSVTNFQSAHDTNGTATTDKFYVKDGDDIEPMEELNTDSVWNFHVWNEAWMKRPDIKEGDCDGWQVIDATPQEQSEGEFCCGPCPVSAIKRGDITKLYDAPFIFAEVNSDRIDWLFDNATQEWTVTDVDPHDVGKCISTKKPDGKPAKSENCYDYREDVTLLYKFKEGTMEERLACKNADKTTGIDMYRDAFNTDGDKKKDVSLKIITEDKYLAGDDFTFKVRLSNVKKKSAERKIQHLQIMVDSLDYSATKRKKILKKKMDDFSLGFEEEKEFEVKVTKEDYLEKNSEYFDFSITGFANIIGEEDTYWMTGIADDNFQRYIKKSCDFRLRRPDINIKCQGKVKVGDKFQAKFAFNNPLPRKLTKCELHVAGNGIKDIDRNEPDVEANGRFIKQYELEAETDGEINIIASFDCNELKDVSGNTTIEVTDD